MPNWGRMRLRILDRYLGRQIMGTTLFGVFVLCLVLVVGNIFKEVLPRLVDQTVSPAYLVQFILLVLPFSLIFTIPWGFLTAVLLVFGRLSADSELVSMRMAGISTFRISLPVILLALAFSSCCLWINVSVAPKAKTAIEQTFFNMATRTPAALLQPDQVVSAFPDHVIYFRKGSAGNMEGLTIFQTDGGHRLTQTVCADQARMKADMENLKIRFEMKNAYVASASGTDLVQKMSRVLAEEAELPPFDLATLRNRRLKAAALTNGQIHEFLAGRGPRPLADEERNTFRTELSKRFSFSLACITFCLVGIPLGITAQRRETAVGFVFSLVVASLYFFFIIIGDTISGRPGPLPHLLIWAPNLIFLGLGAWMFHRLNRR